MRGLLPPYHAGAADCRPDRFLLSVGSCTSSLAYLNASSLLLPFSVSRYKGFPESYSLCTSLSHVSPIFAVTFLPVLTCPESVGHAHLRTSAVESGCMDKSGPTTGCEPKKPDKITVDYHRNNEEERLSWRDPPEPSDFCCFLSKHMSGRNVVHTNDHLLCCPWNFHLRQSQNGAAISSR